MQAAKIQVGQLYALKFPNKLGSSIIVRFRVTTVETTQRRSRQGKADSESWIEGVINPEDIPAELLPEGKEERQEFLKRRVPPESITGTYEEHQELVARETAAQAASKAEALRCKQQADALRQVFYQLTNLPTPAKPDEYNQPFRALYGRTVEISVEGVEALLKALTPSPHPHR